jgi:hypothetical protein
VLARAALLRPAALEAMLRAYPPGRPPADAAEFARRLLHDAAAWDERELRAAATARTRQGRGRSLAFEWSR